MKSPRRYIRAAAVAVSIAVVAAIVFSLIQPTRYAAETSIAVGSQEDVISAQFGDQAQSITNTVAQLMRSEVVAKTVIQRLKLKQSVESFMSNLSISQKPDAAVLTVQFKAPSKAKSVAALNELNTVFQQQLKSVANAGSVNPKAPTGPTLTPEGDSPLLVKVRVFDPPHALPAKVSPRPLRNLAIAVLLGLIIAVFWVAFRESREAERQGAESGTESDDKESQSNASSKR